jgi:hypothetical protein
MSEPDTTSPDPLGGSGVAAYWIYGFDMPDEAGGGFVTGELLLRTDGVLLRRPTLYTTAAGGLKPGFGPWEEVPWWKTDVTDPERAARILHYRGYDLHKREPADPSQPRNDQSPR